MTRTVLNPASNGHNTFIIVFIAYVHYIAECKRSIDLQKEEIFT